MQNIKMPFLMAVIGFVIVFQGCGRNDNERQADNPPKGGRCSEFQDDDIVLAVVNGSEITNYDIRYTIKSTFGKNAPDKPDAGFRKKVLESLVASRAISQAIEGELTPCEKMEIDKKVNAHREELLVQKYLLKHAQPEPITMDLIRSYYEAHPAEFGAKTARIYELITGTRPLRIQERDHLLSGHERPSQQKNWKDWSEKLRQKGYPISYRTGEVSEDLPDKKLFQLLNPLKKGEAMDFSFIDSMLYAARIIEEKKIAPRPIEDVSARIRESLAPIQIKKAVKKASDQVLKTATVTYK